jgi:hypothetical protein
MSSFDDKYWNLSQVAAWVVYRDQQLIEILVEPSREAFAALERYPNMALPPGTEKIGSIIDLSNALIDGRVVAWGYRTEGTDTLEKISSREWTDLDIAPPYVYDAKCRSQLKQPWTHVRLEKAKVVCVWRSIHEVSGRTKFDKSKLLPMYQAIRSENPKFSQNELIIEFQGRFRDTYNKEPPSRITVQRYIKSWT